MPGRLVKQWRQEVEKFLLPGVVDLELWEGQELPAQGRDRRSLLLAPIEVLRKRLRDGQPPVLGRLGLRRLVVDEFHEHLDVAKGIRKAPWPRLISYALCHDIREGLFESVRVPRRGSASGASAARRASTTSRPWRSWWPP